MKSRTKEVVIYDDQKAQDLIYAVKHKARAAEELLKYIESKTGQILTLSEIRETKGKTNAAGVFLDFILENQRVSITKKISENEKQALLKEVGGLLTAVEINNQLQKYWKVEGTTVTPVDGYTGLIKASFTKTLPELQSKAYEQAQELIKVLNESPELWRLHERPMFNFVLYDPQKGYSLSEIFFQ